MKCRYCPRPLRTKVSRDRGYGLICGQKLGLIPKPTPRHRPALTPIKPVMTGRVHPDQITIPIQPQLPEDPHQ
ncbi:hypothetical protein GCM10010372_30950 [Streptomyces tauricus]|uniref:DUF6011 domain-containing protein n=1 Tax=Streptomyces tauricus TaxID=68274 RepID=UPI001671AF1D|nr:DUF6011 domain-containing protein [Streptomyces tauricus]GHA28882.1 hypothetical protein GCM10010372_30950 [Streptomyces tauricus]